MSQPAQQQTPPGTQPAELTPVHVLLASDEAGYITGQTLHANGGVLMA